MVQPNPWNERRMDANRLTFLPFSGRVPGLYTNDNHMIFKWAQGEVYASLTQQGKAVSAHLACSACALRELKRAINEFCDYVFWLFDWCEMVIAQITRPSVERIAMKCGFHQIGEAENVNVYARFR